MKRLMDSKVFKLLRNTFILVVTFILPIILIIIFGKDLKAIEQHIPETGLAGPLFSILIMGVLSATPIPTDPIVILNGAIFGPSVGILVSWMGNNLAAILEYFIGKGIGEITDFDKQKKKLPFGLSKFPADSVWFLIFARFVPSFGGKIVSITGGVYHVPFWKYLWTAVVSNLFGSVLLALGGYSLLHTLAK
jgi:uncharacterized membrane protein YdjX (TVP38/TMEM64 family)